MDLFDHQRERLMSQEAPLAARMRPRTLADFVGQEHLVGEGRVLRKSIEADQLSSMILWGPPGSGKTTLAYVIATITKSHFSPVSAVSSGGPHRGPSCSLMRSIASTRLSRTPYCRMWRMAR